MFTGDTAPSPAVTSLAKGADLLISEVIDVPATISLVEQATKGDCRRRQIFFDTWRTTT